MIAQVRRASVVCELPTTYITCYYFLFCRLSQVFPHVRLTAATTSRHFHLELSMQCYFACTEKYVGVVETSKQKN